MDCDQEISMKKQIKHMWKIIWKNDEVGWEGNFFLFLPFFFSLFHSGANFIDYSCVFLQWLFSVYVSDEMLQQNKF